MPKQGDGLTKQGVRDLNQIPAKSRGVRLEPPPKPSQVCRHPQDLRRILWSGDTYCSGCGETWDWDGLPW